MKTFYSHLIEIESLTVELDNIDLAEHEKHELARLLDRNIHNVVMDVIFSKLSEQDKERFAALVISGDHEKIWDYLKSKAENVEEVIKKAASDIKEQLHHDVKEAKTR